MNGGSIFVVASRREAGCRRQQRDDETRRDERDTVRNLGDCTVFGYSLVSSALHISNSWVKISKHLGRPPVHVR